MAFYFLIFLSSKLCPLVQFSFTIFTSPRAELRLSGSEHFPCKSNESKRRLLILPNSKWKAIGERTIPLKSSLLSFAAEPITIHLFIIWKANLSILSIKTKMIEFQGAENLILTTSNYNDEVITWMCFQVLLASSGSLLNFLHHKEVLFTRRFSYIYFKTIPCHI